VISLNLNKLRLKWKVFAFLLGFCFLLLIILWLFQTVFLNDMYRFIRKRELERAIAIVEREFNNPELQTIMQDIQAENDIIIAFTPEFTPPQRIGREVIGRRGNAPLETITEVKEFTLENGRTLSLTFYAMVAPVGATVTTLRYQLYFISGIMFLLAVGLALIISRRISEPIEEINQNALNLAKGDYNTRFSGKGFYEIVALSDTLNTAAVELGRVESLRRELLANVSHDLRTPLSLIYSYAEMMNDFPAEITAEQTKVIMDETRRLTSLVNDILDVSKLEADMERLNISLFNLTQNILETTERMNELVKSDGFQIDFTYDGNIYVKADKTKIDRVFYNLLVNAVNYSGDDKQIVIKQTISENCVRISITDRGEGVAEEELPFIWDRYYKSGKKHKRAVTGTGLGLSIVKKIMKLHGGNYGVTSEVDCGSTFWFEVGIE